MRSRALKFYDYKLSDNRTTLGDNRELLISCDVTPGGAHVAGGGGRGRGRIRGSEREREEVVGDRGERGQNNWTLFVCDQTWPS